MRPKLFTFCAAVSLVLCAAVCGLWVRSHSKADILRHESLGDHWDPIATRPDDDVSWFRAGPSGGTQTGWSFRSSRGILEAGRRRSAFRPSADVGWADVAIGGAASASSEPDGPETSPRFLGFDVESGTRTEDGSQDEYLYVSAPHWAVAAATALLPAWWSVRWHRGSRRAQAGRCPACGYDLRATPDLCPECGTVARKPAAA